MTAPNTMTNDTTDVTLDSLHHVAIPVKDVARAVDWYRDNFRCAVDYQDDTWALLGFGNVKLALVLPEQHPPHIAFVHPHPERYGEVRPHRDGTRSSYAEDSEGNFVEMLADENLD